MTTIRRIVTGHDAAGNAVFVEDDYCPHVLETHSARVVNIWLHEGKPDNSGPYKDPVGDDVPLPPPPGGSVFRTVEFPPSAAESRPYVHRTMSLDYAYVIEGEIYALVDGEETLMKAGDCLVQRGTNHAWDNRSGANATVLFVLLDAEPIAP